jgi:hypothetical protein
VRNGLALYRKIGGEGGITRPCRGSPSGPLPRGSVLRGCAARRTSQ